MLNAGNPIGVMDSGIGGLTVVRELQRILPGEDIIYFGDSANCPYGNKTSDQIFSQCSNNSLPASVSDILFPIRSKRRV